MAFVDEIRLHLKAGKGGDGVVRWLHEKGKPLMGPAGGDGGNGGDVYVKAFREMHGLARYARKKSYEAENGDNGAKNKSSNNIFAELECEYAGNYFLKNRICRSK